MMLQSIFVPGFQDKLILTRYSWKPHAQPPPWRARVSFLVQNLVLLVARLPLAYLSYMLMNTSSITWLNMPLLTWRHQQESHNTLLSNVSTRIVVSLTVSTHRSYIKR